MKKTILIIISIFGGLAALIAAFVIVLTAVLNRYENIDAYTLGEDRIASVKSVVGARDISSLSFSVSEETARKTYVYRSKSCEEDVESYTTYLTGEGFLPVYEDNRLVYARESVEDGKILTVDIVKNGLNFTVTIQKGEGALDLFL